MPMLRYFRNGWPVIGSWVGDAPRESAETGPCPHGEYVCTSCAGDQAKEVEHSTVDGVGSVGRLLKRKKRPRSV